MIYEADTKGYIMTTTINAHNSSNKNNMAALGLLEDHSYTLLGCASVEDSRGTTAYIVCIRNPWGRFEWNGDWSDHSDLWTE